MRLYGRKVRDSVLAGLPPVWLYNHPRRKYVEQKILATPPWVSHREMLAIHVRKLKMNEETGIKHTLDHIIPLNHPMVCGLNVPWNLRIVPNSVNARKSNHWSPDQMELLS